MFLIVFKCSQVIKIFSINHFTLSLHLVISEISLINFPILKTHLSPSMSCILLPVSIKFITVNIIQNSQSILLIVLNLTFIYRSIFECINSLNFTIFVKLTLITFPIRIILLTHSLLSILEKITLIYNTIIMFVLSMTMSHSILHCPLINISIRKSIFSFSLSDSINHISFINRTIRQIGSEL